MTRGNGGIWSIAGGLGAAFWLALAGPGAAAELKVLTAGAFKQVVLNLLSNSVKFTLPGGQVIIDSEVEHSVVLERSRIVGVHRLMDSLIGRDVEVKPSPERPKATRLMVGDHCVIEL